ncbi:MAG TPA: hypothetical protein VKG84_05895 [Candidatus Acidoferrales bacterium]|nr:hypothetical protein [Candidatus Acidoferrales bacterium]
MPDAWPANRRFVVPLAALLFASLPLSAPQSARAQSPPPGSSAAGTVPDSPASGVPEKVPATAEAINPPGSPVIVVGFVGGYVRHDDAVHSVVQVARRLTKTYPEEAAVTVMVYENHHGQEAHGEILRLLDAGHDGAPTAEEKKAARIVIFGHSWGASETVTLARRLESEGIPVLLTIQVDSVSKRGEDDGTIPGNVAEAANFYQLDGFIHGRREIRAEDPAKTQILGNYHFAYKEHPVTCNSPYPWYSRVFMKAHTEIECDPTVWDKVESLIRSKLPKPAGTPAS